MANDDEMAASFVRLLHASHRVDILRFYFISFPVRGVTYESGTTSKRTVSSAPPMKSGGSATWTFCTDRVCGR